MPPRLSEPINYENTAIVPVINSESLISETSELSSKPVHKILVLMHQSIFITIFILVTLANSEDPDEMPHNVAFHQGLHCLQR